MFLKYCLIFSILVCGQCVWKYNDNKSNQTNPELLGYKLIADDIPYGGKNSVSGLERVYIPKRHSIMPSGLVNLSKFEKVDSERTLKFAMHIKISELLLSGEQVFKAKRKEKAIETRAYLYGQEECKRLQLTFVANCKVKEISINHEPDGILHIAYQFGFVQNIPFGELSKNADLIYEEERIQFYEIFEHSERSTIEQEKTRSKYYFSILEYCEKIRWLLGTCAVDSIRFKHASKMKSSNSFDALMVDVNFTSLVALENKQITVSLK